MNKVSIYIPVYNGELYLDRTLEAIFQQTVPFSEIIVINDGSQDNTVQIAEQYPVKIISHNYNKGIALARNTGVENCGCELVASVDADCVLDKHWLEECILFFEDESVAGVGGKLCEEMKKRVPDRWRRINLIQHFGDETKEISFISGSNTIFRKDDLFKVGLYNQNFKLYYEDIDLSERLIRSGRRLIYAHRARVSHIRQDTVYSVMRTCWGFRNRRYPTSLIALLKDILREFKHAVSIIGKSLLKMRLSILVLDCVYIFYQVYFCLKSYFLKTINFR